MIKITRNRGPYEMDLEFDGEHGDPMRDDGLLAALRALRDASGARGYSASNLAGEGGKRVLRVEVTGYDDEGRKPMARNAAALVMAELLRDEKRGAGGVTIGTDRGREFADEAENERRGRNIP